jgi:5-oxoprolinase (ATP-hydrolysing)
VFWFNLLVSGALFLILLVVGPLYGHLQGRSVVGWLLVAYGLKLLFQNTYAIPFAMLRRELRFEEIAKARTLAHLAESVARVLATLEDCAFEYEMDQGCFVKVKITVDRANRRATVDFTGTGPQRADNFNAPEPVTQAAVLYVFRTLVKDRIPLNAGCLRNISIIVPKGSMLSPQDPAAVVAGNVEVSQAVTDCLYGALGLLAGAQGTMNNLTFGDGSYQYYETICSGAPAGEGFHGADAVHTHMTNSRLTDP